jgi:y4mF family transcriptional regulator
MSPFVDTTRKVVVRQHFHLVAVRQHARVIPMTLTSVTDIAARVRQARQDRGWTQVQLAEHSGVSRDWIIALEKAKPSLEIALVLRTLKALNLSLKMEEPGRQQQADEVIDIDDLLDAPKDQTS